MDESGPAPNHALEMREFDQWARPWIHAVKLTDEYVGHWRSILEEFGESRARATVRALRNASSEVSDDCGTRLHWLAVGWRLPAGPVDPFDFDDCGADLTAEVLREARARIPAPRSVREVDYSGLVDVFKSLAESADHVSKLEGLARGLLFEIFASDTKDRLGGSPFWPIPPVVRVDIDLLHPNAEIARQIDALRRQYGVASAKRPGRTAVSTESLLVGFRIRHERRQAPGTPWVDLYRRFLGTVYDKGTLTRIGLRLRAATQTGVDAVRREVLADPAALPAAGYAERVVSVDGEFRVQTVWREPKRTAEGYAMETKRVVRP